MLHASSGTNSMLACVGVYRLSSRSVTPFGLQGDARLQPRADDRALHETKHRRRRNKELKIRYERGAVRLHCQRVAPTGGLARRWLRDGSARWALASSSVGAFGDDCFVALQGWYYSSTTPSRGATPWDGRMMGAAAKAAAHTGMNPDTKKANEWATRGRCLSTLRPCCTSSQCALLSPPSPPLSCALSFSSHPSLGCDAPVERGRHPPLRGTPPAAAAALNTSQKRMCSGVRTSLRTTCAAAPAISRHHEQTAASPPSPPSSSSSTLLPSQHMPRPSPAAGGACELRYAHTDEPRRVRRANVSAELPHVRPDVVLCVSRGCATQREETHTAQRGTPAARPAPRDMPARLTDVRRRCVTERTRCRAVLRIDV